MTIKRMKVQNKIMIYSLSIIQIIKISIRHYLKCKVK